MSHMVLSFFKKFVINSLQNLNTVCTVHDVRIQLILTNFSCTKRKHNRYTVSFLHVSASQEYRNVQEGNCVSIVFGFGARKVG